ncbi:hypothetical protein D9M68_734080 [compost metagenome]
MAIYDYFLKAADDTAMTAALLGAGVAEIQDGALVATPPHGLDIIGAWYETVDEEPVQIPGFYVNVWSPDPALTFQGVDIETPRTPWRVRAGV